MITPTRRDFLATGAVGATGLLPSLGWAEPNPPRSDAFGFFLIGDTHFLADEQDKAKVDERSARITQRFVDTLNQLPGTEIPENAGGGRVLTPQGVIHAGDCIDTGDKANVMMQRTEWAVFAETLGLTGQDGKLKFPIYEVHGNHDSPRGEGHAVKQIIERNKKRPGVTNVSDNGLHYSWDWGNVHFVNLGIVVGQVAEVDRQRRYAPLGSLEFLVADLKKNVGESRKPVIITHHIDMLRYAKDLPIDDKTATGMEWDPADVRGYHDAIRGYHVAGILYGHTHARNVYRWDGTAKAAAEGIPTFNVDNGSHFAGQQQAFFYFEFGPERMLVREYQTKDAWETGSWTPQTWTVPLAVAAQK